VDSSWFPSANRLRFDRLSRCDRLGLAAAHEALRDSGLDLGSVPSGRMAVVLGCGAGGLLSGEIFKKQMFDVKKPRPSLLVPFSASAFTDCLAMAIGSRGMRATIATACSSSATAIGLAGELIKKGLADVVITGGSESLSETTFSGFNSLRAVDEEPCRPFDRERKGISLGEGAAIFVVEGATGACDMGALRSGRATAEIAGYGLSADAYHITAPAPDGACVSEAIRLALVDAGMEPADIDYINAHGTGTTANDSAETNAIKLVFGKRAYDIPISSTKSLIGHCLGAAGALEAAASILALQRGVIHPTLNYKNPDPECDLDYVPGKAGYKTVKAVLSNSLAFGGNNTALILRAL